MKRYESIDVMRALALILMVPCHFVLFFSPYEAPYEGLYTAVNEILGGLSAPLFLVLVGISQAVSLNNKADTGGLFNEIGSRMLRRAAIVFFAGVLHKIALEASLYEWGILTLIGSAIAVLCLIRRLPSWGILLLCIAVFFVSPGLRELVGFLTYWSPEISTTAFSAQTPAVFMDPLDEYTYASSTELKYALTGFLVTGYFPIFPWIVFPLLGFSIGKLLYCKKKQAMGDETVALSGVLLLGVGAYLARLAYLNGTPNFESGFLTTFYFFPLSPTWLLVQSGFSLIVIVFCRALFDGRKFKGVLLEYCHLLSRYSLTVYILHLLIAYWVPRGIGLFTGQGIELIGNWVSTPTAVLLSLVTLQGFYFLFKAWDDRGGKFSFEWMLNWLTQPKPSGK